MPDWRRTIRERLSELRLDPAREAAVAEELAQHAGDRYEELLSRGVPPPDAERSVLGELERGRLVAALRPVLPPASARPAPGQDEPGIAAGVWKDLRHGLRLLRLDPAFAVVAVLSLALGIGANTAIFQLLDAVRLRALPVQRPHELAAVRVADSPNGRTGWFSGRHPEITSGIWERLRDEPKGFSSIAAWSSQRLNLSPGGEVRFADTLWASGSLFETLGVQPLLGRLLSPADDRRGCAPGPVVLSEAFWQREFGADPSAVGRKISLDGRPFEVVGITPASFFGLDVGRRFDVALPLCAEAAMGEQTRTNESSAWWLAVVGRLKPGWTIERASAEVRAQSAGIFRATLPPAFDAVNGKHYLESRLEAYPAASGLSSLRRQYADPLWLLLGISGLVLLIACANLANLMVARASARHREIAVRLALGASRRRLVQQLLAESFVLAALGAAWGAALAQALSRLLVSSLATQDTRPFVVLHFDWRLFAFTAGLAGLTCLLFGLLPAIQAARTEPIAAIKSGGRGIAGSHAGLGTRRALVVSQVSLSLVLVVGALLFAETFRKLQSIDPGFRRDHILVTDFGTEGLRIPPAARDEYTRMLLSRVRAIPGVVSAAATLIVPASGSGWNDSVRIDGSAVTRELANFNRVSPGYFATMGTPLRAGRDFTEADRAGSVPVAVVTETFARKFLGGSSPLGRTFRIVNPGPKADHAYEIVGMVKDAKYTDLREEFTPIVFLASAQNPEPPPGETLLIRSQLPPASLVSAVKTAIAQVNPSIVVEFHVFETSLREGLLRERLMAALSGYFGFLAALLAMVGLYGVISYMVVRRRNEIGVRMAMGATRRDIVVMILREAGALLGAGLAIGVVLSIAAAHAARSLLFGLRPGDPVTLAIAVAGLSAVAAAASLLPARRAAALDPMAALREE
jgi:predicted permease